MIKTGEIDEERGRRNDDRLREIRRDKQIDLPSCTERREEVRKEGRGDKYR